MRLSLVLAFLFFIGSCFGWVLELLYRNLTHRHKKWINPGFCTGPYLPIYGFGLCTLFLLASMEDLHLIANPVWNRVVLFIAMAVAMTLIEYIAGIACLKYLKVRLWDYSNLWGNIQGIICPLFSFFWAALGAAYYFLIHPYILNALAWLSNNLAFSFFHWHVLRCVHHRRGAFQPDHRQAEAVRRGKQGRREIREHQGPYPGFQPERRRQVPLFLPFPFGQPSCRAFEGNVSQAGKAERQPKVNFGRLPLLLAIIKQ